jgi:hypothetical protein
MSHAAQALVYATLVDSHSDGLAHGMGRNKGHGSRKSPRNPVLRRFLV